MRLLIFFLLLSQYALAQTSASVGVSISLPSVALLDVEPNNSGFNLDMTTPNEAGSGISARTTNNTKWLNFTSAVTSGTSRRIAVQLSGALPTGLNLKLVTANYSGSGAGKLGSPVPTIYLSNTQQTIVNNIGGAYTGNGSGNGFNLTYSLEVTDYSLLRSQNTTISIIYTLIDN